MHKFLNLAAPARYLCVKQTEIFGLQTFCSGSLTTITRSKSRASALIDRACFICTGGLFQLPKNNTSINSDTSQQESELGLQVPSGRLEGSPIYCRTFCTSSSTTSMSVPRSGESVSPYVVGHDKRKKMFYIKLSDGSGDQKGSLAKLEYSLVRPGLVDLYHTEVPPEFQGQGIAKVLVLAGLDHFCENDVLIRPSCTYVQRVLKQNPTSQYKEHVEEGYLNKL